MSAELLRKAAGRLEDAAYIPGLGPALPESLALLLVNEANAMEARHVPYNLARQDLLVGVARAVLAVTA